MEHWDFFGVERAVCEGQGDLPGSARFLDPLIVGIDGPDSADYSTGNHDEQAQMVPLMVRWPSGSAAAVRSRP